MIETTHVISVLVALITAISVYASKQSSAKAAGKLQIETSRVDMEKNAYDRARAFDTETIARQNQRIAELVGEVKALDQEVDKLRIELRECNRLRER